MKSKLDLILDHIRELSAGREPQRPTALPPEPQRPTALPPEPQPPSALPPEPQPLSASPPDPFVYSSLDYWRSLAECVSQLKRGVWDLEVAKFCSEVLLPKVSRLQVTDRYCLWMLTLAQRPQLIYISEMPVTIARRTTCESTLMANVSLSQVFLSNYSTVT